MKMIPLTSTTVIRDGERVTPALNEAFDFTKEEIDYIKAVHPDGLRKPVNESVEDKPLAPETGAPPKTVKAKKAAAATNAGATDVDGEQAGDENEGAGDGDSEGGDNDL